MSQEQHPAMSVDRIASRERLGLRSIREDEEGRNIRNQPAGVFGFTGAPATDELPLFVRPTFRCFEVQKLSSGEVSIVGYVTEKESQAFGIGTEPIMINLFPDPHGESVKLVSVPLSRIDRRKPPTRDEGNSMMVEVAPLT